MSCYFVANYDPRSRGVPEVRRQGGREFRRWYDSLEYQEILAHRLKGADCTTILVRGH